MKNLSEVYKSKTMPYLQKELGISNTMALPKISKVIINVGISQEKRSPEYLKIVASTLERISGQRPVINLAKKSIAAFKVREGMEVGMKVTLRGKRMDDFLTKFVNVTLPRTRDFRGLRLSNIDRQGNLSIGLRENIVFPEINPDEIDKLHGLEVVIVTTAGKKDDAEKLFTSLGFPFAAKQK